MGLIVRDFQQGLVKAVRKKNSAFLSVKVFSSKVLIDSYWRWDRHTTMSFEPRKSLVVWTAWHDFHSLFMRSGLPLRVEPAGGGLKILCRD